MAEKITCKRCSGNGLVSGMHVVYAGAPGGCFKCAGRGWLYKDKFLEAFAFSPKGEWFGVTMTGPLGPDRAYITKSIVRGERAKLEADVGLTSEETFTMTPITEEQARAFFAKYGTEFRRVFPKISA